MCISLVFITELYIRDQTCIFSHAVVNAMFATNDFSLPITQSQVSFIYAAQNHNRIASAAGFTTCTVNVMLFIWIVFLFFLNQDSSILSDIVYFFLITSAPYYMVHYVFS